MSDENEVWHIVLRYSTTSQWLILTTQFDHYYSYSIIIHHNYSGTSYTPQNCVVYIASYTFLPASPPAITMRPPLFYISYFSLYIPSQMWCIITNALIITHTRSPRDCDAVINTSFTLDLLCQRERERERERERGGGEEEEEGGGTTTMIERYSSRGVEDLDSKDRIISKTLTARSKSLCLHRAANTRWILYNHLLPPTPSFSNQHYAWVYTPSPFFRNTPPPPCPNAIY